jgi:DNA-binding SARP family transcriptional activator
VTRLLCGSGSLLAVRSASQSATDDVVHLGLLGGFELSCRGERIGLPVGAQRLVGYLALQQGASRRGTAAEALWPDRRIGRAAGNLRSALCQTRSITAAAIIDSYDGQIRLSRSLQVDVREISRWAHENAQTPNSTRYMAKLDEVIMTLSRELLPDWPDDWLLAERERWDGVRLHTLEVLTRHLINAERYLSALEAALTARAPTAR